MTPTPELPYRAIVAIDFGTARSGYAFAFLRDRQIAREYDWPDQPHPVIKTLTHLLYDAAGEATAWGYTVMRMVVELRQRHEGRGYQLYKAFKTALRDGAIGPHGPLFEPGQGGTPVPVIDLIADYLERLKTLALQRLQRSVTGGVTERDVLWCLTVPALWSEREKWHMRQAAERAGLIGGTPEDVDRLCLVLEPEAAALYCLHKDAASGVSQLQAGSRFMIVDAGGGTIDLTVHEVTRGGGLDEVIQSSGKMCGSTTIDSAFKRYLETRFGKQVVRAFSKKYQLDWWMLMTDWERAKCGYDSTSPHPYTNITLPLPFVTFLKKYHLPVYQEFRASQGKEVSYLKLDRETMEALFAPTIEQTIKAVDEHLQRLNGVRLDYLFLVGGFGQSPVLQRRLTEAVCQRVGRVVVPAEPGAAVLLGAVHFGLGPGDIVSRRSRRTYGVRALVPFRPDVDPPDRAIDKESDGQWCAQFIPFVKKDERIPFGHQVTRRFAPVRGTQYRARFNVYSSATSVGPYFDEDDCKYLGALIIEIPDQAASDDRAFDVTFHFGRTEIAVKAVDSVTGERRVVVLDFRTDLERRAESGRV